MNSFKTLLGQANLLFVTLDTLRYDAAQQAWRTGELKTLGPYLDNGWELRHSPASFTYAAHHAFFSGFLPTPARAGPHARLFASSFSGSTSIDESTYVFSQATLPEALQYEGYQTLCVGGTGFFNLQNEIGSVLPNLFETKLWSEDLSVSCHQSPQNQCKVAAEWISNRKEHPLFAFINCAAIHQPNWFYGQASDGVETQGTDTLDTHRHALVAFDCALQRVFTALLGHPVVWQVPYAEFWL